MKKKRKLPQTYDYLIIPANISASGIGLVFRALQGERWGNKKLLFRRVDSTVQGGKSYILCLGFRHGDNFTRPNPKDGPREEWVQVSLPVGTEKPAISKYFLDRFGLVTVFLDPTVTETSEKPDDKDV